MGREEVSICGVFNGEILVSCEIQSRAGEFADHYSKDEGNSIQSNQLAPILST